MTTSATKTLLISILRLPIPSSAVFTQNTKRLLVMLVLCLPALGATHYVDYATGSDTNNGTSTSTPWKHAPGMKGLTPSGSSTGDGCSNNCASYTPAPGDFIILKGGTVWPYTVLPWQWPSNAGSGSTSTYGCAGTGCIYVGNAVGAGLSAWNSGKVTGVWLTRDLGGWTPSSTPAISCSGGGGSGAAASSVVVPSGNTDSNIAGFIYNISLTNGGSGYTSAPTCTFTSGSGTAKLKADIDRAIIDGGSTQGSPADWPIGQCGSFPTTCQPALTFGSNFMIISGLEIRNFKVQNDTAGGVNDEQEAFLQIGGNNVTASNIYTHGFFLDCAIAGSCSANGEFEHWAIAPQGAHDEVANSVMENGDSGFLGTGTSAANNVCGNGQFCTFGAFGIGTGTQSGSGPVSSHGNIEYMNSWQLRYAGNDASGSDPYLSYGNEFWLTVYQMNNTAHINSRYMQLVSNASLISYNNIVHSQVGGTSSQIQCAPGMTYYFFNEVTWGIGTGTLPYSLDIADSGGTGGCALNLYNDTMYSNNTNACENTQPAASTTTITMQNLHCITGTLVDPYWQTANGNVVQNYAGSTTSETVQSSSVAQGLSTANSQGYASTNLFAPISSSNGTVSFSSNANSANLTSLCSGNFTALCSDINGSARPASGGWQAGAYQLGSSTSAPQPPSGLSALVN
jgi:hypothetical protein